MTSKEFDRRQFSAKSAAAFGAVAALGLSFEEQALFTHQAQAAEPPSAETSVSGPPKGKIGNDFVCSGMFDGQVRENVGIANKVLVEDAVRNRTRSWRA